MSDLLLIAEFKGDWDFLSNFHPWETYYDGEVYPTAEHAFQASKTLRDYTRTLIRLANTPKEAKAIGRQVTLRPNWDTYRLTAMRDVVRSKFTPSPGYKYDEKRDLCLLATGTAGLVEGNWWHDNFWGHCLCNKCESKEGKNYLGRILMEVREEIRQHKYK